MKHRENWQDAAKTDQSNMLQEMMKSLNQIKEMRDGKQKGLDWQQSTVSNADQRQVAPSLT